MYEKNEIKKNKKMKENNENNVVFYVLDYSKLLASELYCNTDYFITYHLNRPTHEFRN